MINIIGRDIFGYMSGFGKDIMRAFGQLCVVSNDIRVAENEAAVVGAKGNTLSSAFDADSVVITTSGFPSIENKAEETAVSGDVEHTVYSNDYLVSDKELSSEFAEDGLNILYAGEADFSLEKVKIGG